MSAPTPDEVPVLRVLTPHASDEEVAALVAVFAALGPDQDPTPAAVPEWSANHRKLRRTFPHGPQGWRSSSLPR